MYTGKKEDTRREREREAICSAERGNETEKKNIQGTLGHCMLLLYPLEFTTEQSSAYQKGLFLQSMGVGLDPQGKASFPSPAHAHCRYGFQIKFILKNEKSLCSDSGCIYLSFCLYLLVSFSCVFSDKGPW